MGGVIDVGHLQDEVYYKNWVAIIPGDPVALPGNEAALGMLKGSGDPFSLSYLTYLPYDGSDLNFTIGPYHWQCMNWLQVAAEGKTSTGELEYRRWHTHNQKFE